MSEFVEFKNAVTAQFDLMKGHKLFRIGVDKDAMWNKYLSSFPEGTNPIFRERTEHDCQYCRNFIRSVGNIVAIIDNKLVTLWDCKVPGFYQVVADEMSNFIKSHKIENIFLHTEKSVGVDKNIQEIGVETITWNHFFINVPKNFIVSNDNLGTKLAESRSLHDVFYRGLNELTLEAIDTVLDLINQCSLYRGDEHKFVVESFRKLKSQFNELKSPTDKDLFSWIKMSEVAPSISGIRNTVIGTLLVDVSDGVMDLDAAVRSFESKVAPTNYKRPTAVVTKAMIESAKKTITELGYLDSLNRRYAKIDDITINNVLFADRASQAAMVGDVFSDITKDVTENIKKYDKVDEVPIETFIKDILPTSESIELLVENKHAGNFVSLIAPVNPEAKQMFKWPNNFSWSYVGEVTDSIKERVKKAGGNVTGDVRISLSWFNYDDLDLSVVEPDGYRIYFRNRHQASSNQGRLDVDMNAGSGTTRSAVENICYSTRNSMEDGDYLIKVHNFSQREMTDTGFEVEIEFDGDIHTLALPSIKNHEYVDVAVLTYSRKKGFTIKPLIPMSSVSKEVWGINTQSFNKVSVVMLSPNYWNEKCVGNKHYFFMLNDCKNEGTARGFFNEFLSEELSKHRKVLEVIGSKMKTEESNEQLSGIGFSSTKKDSILCRVTSKFSRVIKLTF